MSGDSANWNSKACYDRYLVSRFMTVESVNQYKPEVRSHCCDRTELPVPLFRTYMGTVGMLKTDKKLLGTPSPNTLQLLASTKLRTAVKCTFSNTKSTDLNFKNFLDAKPPYWCKSL